MSYYITSQIANRDQVRDVVGRKEVLDFRDLALLLRTYPNKIVKRSTESAGGPLPTL